VLRGARALLSAREHPAVIFETQAGHLQRAGVLFSDLQVWFAELGYRLFALLPRGLQEVPPGTPSPPSTNALALDPRGTRTPSSASAPTASAGTSPARLLVSCRNASCWSGRPSTTRWWTPTDVPWVRTTTCACSTPSPSWDPWANGWGTSGRSGFRRPPS
jgi:hypothetical protein